MKCLDKKRIKMKGGETLALNERIMLSLVSTGVSVTHFILPILTSTDVITQYEQYNKVKVHFIYNLRQCLDTHTMVGIIYLLQEGSPFIVCMTYAFQTPEKLCFILDLMNGGDLHYHLSQHGVFSEKEVRFYAAEVILGLEHMHNRFVVYRDLKVWLPMQIYNFWKN